VGAFAPGGDGACETCFELNFQTAGVRARARGADASEVCASLAHPQIRGRREGRVPAGTRGPCAEEVHRANHRYSRDIPALPARMVLTAYSALSPATNSSCHRHRRIEWCCPIRLDQKHLRRLDTSNGCQDHTALPSATAPFVLRAPIAHETWKVRPAIAPRARRCRVHRIPDPTSVTIAIRPSVRAGMAAINN
jgi:hypothetical protein